MANKTLDLDLEDDTGEFIEMLKDLPRITPSEVNRGMEILRMRGNTQAIEKLRQELGAMTEQARNKLGQWVKK